MRAVVLMEPNATLQVMELRDPDPGQGEVRIDVAACGVCHTDLHVMKGEVKFPTPAVLGHEISGVVSGVGQGVAGIHVGDRVASSFIMPCGHCRHCVRGADDLCETFFAYNRLSGTLYDGTSRLALPGGEPVAMYSMGGLATQCVVPATDVFAVPDSLKLRDVATLGCSALTAYGAIRNVADVRPGDTVAVVGVGGVGSALVQLAAVFGAARIVAIDVADDKLAAAVRLGATDVVNVRKEDVAGAVASITGGRGVDAAFEALGSSATFEAATDIVGDGGAVVVIGIAAAGVKGSVDLSRLPRRKLRILGSYGARPRTDMPELIGLVERKAFVPQAIVSRRFSLDDAAAAYGALARGEITGRAVIDVGGQE